jgi:hypothetical protein
MNTQEQRFLDEFIDRPHKCQARGCTGRASGLYELTSKGSWGRVKTENKLLCANHGLYVTGRQRTMLVLETEHGGKKHEETLFPLKYLKVELILSLSTKYAPPPEKVDVAHIMLEADRVLRPEKHQSSAPDLKLIGANHPHTEPQSETQECFKGVGPGLDAAERIRLRSATLGPKRPAKRRRTGAAANGQTNIIIAFRSAPERQQLRSKVVVRNTLNLTPEQLQLARS